MRDGFRRVDAGPLKVEEVRETRKVKTSQGSSDVTEVVVSDATGRITLSLWNEQKEGVEAGMLLSVRNGYVTSYRGSLQLQVGKYGQLETALP